MSDYKARVYTQLLNWVNGKSNHNVIDNECCPDFSCCHPDMFESDRGKRIKQFNDFKERNNMKKHFDA